METQTMDILTSLNVSVLTSQKKYLEERALQEGLSAPSEYLRQLIHEDQQRKAEKELEEMLATAIENDEWIEGTPEYWATKRVELAVRFGQVEKA